MSYSRCICQNCGNHYATAINDAVVIQNEACPNCGKRQLKLSGELSPSEINSLFYSGG